MARQLSAATMAANWQKGVGAAGVTWTGGIANPRQNPNANPQQNASNWVAGVSNGEPAYLAGISNPNFMSNWQNGAKNKQASYTGSGAAKVANFAAAAARLVPMITQSMSALPAKGPKGTNTQRSTAFQQAMHALKGQGKGK